MKKIEFGLSLVLLVLFVLSITLMLLILYKYYIFIKIDELFNYLLLKVDSNFNPENLLSISVSLNTGFGALILIFYGLVIPKSNLSLKGFIKYFLLSCKYRFIALISIPLTIILAIFLSNFDSYNAIHIAYKLLIPIPIISYLILFVALFEIDNKNLIHKHVVSYLHKLILLKGIKSAVSAYSEITCQFSIVDKLSILDSIIEQLSRDGNMHGEQMHFFDYVYAMVIENEK